MPTPASLLQPVRKSVTVRLPRERAFELFTARIHEWWPLRTHSIGQADAQTVVFEGREGGRVYERTAAGMEHQWGTVLAWTPPDRILMTWHPGNAAHEAQRVEVRFFPVAGGTRLELTHAGWEALGDRATDYRSNYEGGWEGVLELFVAGAGAA
jgi:uncharacterized protein YndB with AHSA1/START domain